MPRDEQIRFAQQALAVRHPLQRRSGESTCWRAAPVGSELAAEAHPVLRAQFASGSLDLTASR